MIRKSIVAVACLMLIGAALIFDTRTPFPGTYALLVCVATAAAVLWGEGSPWLEAKGLVHLGRISYSAYLWHWPVVAFLTYLQIALSPQLGIVLLPLVLLVAHLSYRWIEKPGRQIQLSLWKLFLVFVAIPAILTTVFFKIANHYDGLFDRFGKESVYIHEMTSPYLDNQKLGCRRTKGTWTDECNFGESDSKNFLYLIGDSHAGHYRWFTEQLATQAKVRVKAFAHGECLMIIGATNGIVGTERDIRCRKAIQADFKEISATRPKFVAIGQRWTGYPFEEVKRLPTLIENLIASEITPIILGPVAEDGRNLKDCFYHHIKLRTPYTGECTISKNNSYNLDKKTRIAGLFAEIRKKYPKVIVIDVQNVQCDREYCAAEIDGVPIYEDTHHINGYGSNTLAKRYIDRFGNPLLH